MHWHSLLRDQHESKLEIGANFTNFQQLALSRACRISTAFLYQDFEEKTRLLLLRHFLRKEAGTCHGRYARPAR